MNDIRIVFSIEHQRKLTKEGVLDEVFLAASRSLLLSDILRFKCQGLPSRLIDLPHFQIKYNLCCQLNAGDVCGGIEVCKQLGNGV